VKQAKQRGGARGHPFIFHLSFPIYHFPFLEAARYFNDKWKIEGFSEHEGERISFLLIL
jgi:hypothetical protein